MPDAERLGFRADMQDGEVRMRVVGDVLARLQPAAEETPRAASG